jgi:cyclic pyranopterin monophosphate synthase
VAELTHVDSRGRARMVDVTAKADTRRVAVARGEIVMQPETLALIVNNQIAKGDVLTVAQVAGIMAAKQTSQIIPMCHPLMLTGIEVYFQIVEAEHKVAIMSTVSTTGKTGVEMEALVATSTAALTIYDMCKAVDRGMRIQNIRLVRKSGGKSGEIVLEEDGDKEDEPCTQRQPSQ